MLCKTLALIWRSSGDESGLRPVIRLGYGSSTT